MYSTPKKERKLFECPSLELAPGKINVFKAPSGTGKTTFLNAICLENRNYDGKVLLDGKEIQNKNESFYRDTCSYVTSDGCFLPDLTVAEQFSLVSGDQEEIGRLSKLLAIDSLLKRKIRKCSRGEQKRVEIVTALLKKSPLLLLDEPTSNLDEKNSKLIFNLLKDYARDHLVIVSSHEDSFFGAECNVYEIADQRIRTGADISAPSENEAEQPVKKLGETRNPKKVFLKLSLTKSFKSKVSFVFSFLFSVLFLIGSFFTGYLANVSRTETLSRATDTGSKEYYEIYYSPSDFDLENKDNDYFSCTAVAVSAHWSGDDRAMNAACVEDLCGNLKDECQKIFDSFTCPFSDTEDTFYHPIILTEAQKKFIESKKVYPEVGQVLDGVSFIKEGYAVPHSSKADCFVLAGFIDAYDENTDFTFGDEGHVGKDDSTFLRHCFPCIVRKDDYIASLRRTGIRNDTINDSLAAVVDAFNEYGKTHPNDYGRIGRDSFYFCNLISYSSVKDELTLHEPGVLPPADGKMYYMGETPAEENWMMLPLEASSDPEDQTNGVDGFYSALTDPDCADFFERYSVNGTYEFPLTDSYGCLELTSQTTFSVSGAYFLNSDDSLTMKSCVIVSDALFEELIGCIRTSTYKKDLVAYHQTYVSKHWIKNHISFLAENPSEIINSHYWEGMGLALDNSLRTKDFAMLLTVIVSGVSVLLLTLYFVNVRRSFSRDFSVLKLLGFPKKRSRMLLFVSFLPTAFLSYLAAVCSAQTLSAFILGAIAKGSLFPGEIVVLRIYSCYLLQLGLLIALFVLSFAFSLLGRKQKSTDVIKRTQ